MHNKKSLDDLEEWLEDWVVKLNSRYIDPKGPKCPYAKSVLDQDRLKIIKMPNALPIEFWSRISNECDNLNDSIDVIVVATEANESLYGHYFIINGGVDALNCMLNVQNKDVWLMSACNELYNVVFIQRITDLDNASKILEKQGSYYKRMSPDYYEKHILQRRYLRERLR